MPVFISLFINQSNHWFLGIGLLGITITGLLIVWRCKPRVPDFHSNKFPESASVYHGVPVFSFKDLEVATKKFDSSRKLGEGGFGTVYYGMCHADPNFTIYEKGGGFNWNLLPVVI